MKLSSILNEDLIFCGIAGEDRETIYKNMLKKVAENISLPIDIEQSCQDVMKREDDVRLPYEKGIALPHLRKPLYDDLYIAVAILPAPVQIKDNDADPCQVVFFSLISEKTSDTYLKSIAAIARFAMTEGSIAKLATCQTPAEVFAVLDEMNVVLKKEITAEDIMARDYPSIDIDGSISDALDIFTRENKIELPVLDQDGKLAGVLRAPDIIHKSIPEYIMMMDNLNFLTSFEPFEVLLKKEQNLMVKEFISEPKAVTPPSQPLIQFTVTLVKGKTRNVFVVDDNNKLLGVITMQEILNKVLRG